MLESSQIFACEFLGENLGKIIFFEEIISNFTCRDHTDVDVPAVYHQFLDTYVSSASEDENQPGPSTSRARATSGRNGSRRFDL